MLPHTGRMAEIHDHSRQMSFPRGVAEFESWLGLSSACRAAVVLYPCKRSTTLMVPAAGCSVVVLQSLASRASHLGVDHRQTTDQPAGPVAEGIPAENPNRSAPQRRTIRQLRRTPTLRCRTTHLRRSKTSRMRPRPPQRRLPVRPMPKRRGQDTRGAIGVIARCRTQIHQSALQHPAQMLCAPLLGPLNLPAGLNQDSQALTATDMLRDATSTPRLRTFEQAPNRTHRALPIYAATTSVRP